MLQSKILPGLAAFGIALVCLASAQYGGWRNVAATLIGVIAGFGLYHAAFGFTGAWRRIISEQRSIGLRAQMLLLGLTVLGTYPLLVWGDGNAWVHPVGIGLVFGAFLFGMGMQLGGGCGSGTLFTVGGGSTRMVITLTFFIIGTMFGRSYAAWWRELPSFDRVSLLSEFGLWGAWAITFAILASLWALARTIELRHHGTLEAGRPMQSLVRGTWSPWAGAVALAGVGVLTMWVLNRPWGITAAFHVWGAHLVGLVGVTGPAEGAWSWVSRAQNISVFQHTTSIMDFGLILGALAASGLAGRFAPVWHLTRREVATAVAGGLLMGFGARLSGGCNIGAYLGGVASGSLHAWAWALAAFAGSSLVVWWRLPRAPQPQPAE
ncbi:MAG: YeeE/YedE family protein [Pseudomonadota bacterium]